MYIPWVNHLETKPRNAQSSSHPRSVCAQEQIGLSWNCAFHKSFLLHKRTWTWQSLSSVVFSSGNSEPRKMAAALSLWEKEVFGNRRIAFCSFYIFSLCVVCTQGGRKLNSFYIQQCFVKFKILQQIRRCKVQFVVGWNQAAKFGRVVKPSAALDKSADVVQVQFLWIVSPAREICVDSGSQLDTDSVWGETPGAVPSGEHRGFAYDPVAQIVVGSAVSGRLSRVLFVILLRS